MTATDRLLTRLHVAGFVVQVEGDDLLLDGPEEALADALLAEITAHKPQLLALLREDWSAWADVPRVSDPDDLFPERPAT